MSLCSEFIVKFQMHEQNFGLGFNQTVTDFETFPNKYVSR